MNTNSYTGTVSPLQLYKCKYSSGDLIYNAHSAEYYLILKIEPSFFGYRYYFHNINKNINDYDIALSVDNSKNLVIV